MAASSKYDLSSGSPNRPLYGSGQRGSYTAASLDRSSSFRENMENPILSALPSMSRSTLAVTQGDVLNFFQCLPLDPKAIAADHKFNRQWDFKRLASVAFGIPPDDSPSGSSKGKLPSPSPEELKRLKAGLRESNTKARERVEIFSKGLLEINKCFPSIPLRKRSRSDILSGDRSNVLFPGDRSVLGACVNKMGPQSHSIAIGFEPEQPKSEERTKNAIPNKRTRTSMVDLRMDVRPNTPARPSGNVDRERELVRLPNSSAVQGEDRTLPIAVDGWEKSKMKKKRSGIKADVAPSTVATKPVDGYREPKQGMPPRILSDARSRLTDNYGFRPGAANGVGKADATSQQTSLGMRSSTPTRVDQDNSSLLHDRRDRAFVSEKERVNLRAINKTSVREELSSSSPTSSTKLNATARAPRSGSGAMPKLSPVIQRSTAANDWELSHCTSKNPAAAGASNRKRTPSTRSSSPPVANWAGQRSQKSSRTARRTNFVPIVSSNDETPALDTISDVGGNENGSGFVRRLPGNSPQQVKLKGDHFSAALSESEESGAAENKSRDKGKKSDEMDEKAGQNVQKVSTPVLPPRKNKLVSGEDLGDGIRRQGRTGRGFTSRRSLMPMTVEKLGNVGTAKQLRTARLGFDKSESKAGRPPTRKLSDRKAYTRQKHTTVNAAVDFLVGSDDGHEELLAAANAVINPTNAFSSSFWRLMEPLFGLISNVDIAYLKRQGNNGSTAVTPNPLPLDLDSSSTAPNGFGLIELGGDATETRSVELSPEHLAPGTGTPNEIPLCQRLLAALISEEGNEESCCSGDEDLKFNVYGSRFEDADMESGAFNHRSLQSFDLAGHASFNSYRITATGSYCNEQEHNLSANDIMSMPDTGITSTFDHFHNGLLPDQSMMPGIACSESKYDNMTLNERLLLEIQSIGLCPEPVPDLAQTWDEEISGDISRLEDKYHEQASKKKCLLGKLLKSTTETRELQEREFERRALDKLVGMAYEKYMSCWGPSAPGGKSASSKMAKQAALAFVKRTLERCQEFEVTGKSCFSEPLFREIFLSGSSHFSDAQPIDASTDGESGKPYVNTSGCSMEVRVSAPIGTLQSPSLNNNDIYSSDPLLSVNHSSEQAIGKEDTWLNRVKRRELLLDEVVGGTVGTSSGAPSGIGTSLSSSAKGKRSERDREGKGNSREVLSRNGTTKIGRPASGNAKGERKSKSKPKQKTTQLSASVNGLLGKMSEQPKTTSSSMPKSCDMTASSNGKEKEEFTLDVLENPEAIDFSNLQMDVLGVPDDLGDQGQDIGSWLNIEDDGLQDHEFMGLEIPMDDLSDLNMMV